MNTVLFWCVLAVMTLAALAFLLLPLLRSRALGEVSRREVNIVLYRERLKELELAHSMGESSAEEMAAAKAELDARLLKDVEQVSHSPHVPPRAGRRVLGLTFIVLFPALAIAVYLLNSDWRIALAGHGPEAVSLLLQRLERRLIETPDDVAGWRLLAQSQLQMRRFDAAAKSYARLNALAPSAETLVGEAEALALAADGNLQGRPATLIDKALRLDPDSARALWYAGLAARQRGDNTAATEFWNRLARQELPDDFRPLLEAQIVQAGGEPKSAPQRFQIPVQVTLDPNFKGRVKSEMSVFIYARAVGQGGAPLAAARHRVSELPLAIVLDDSQSMLPGRKLSSVDRWTITARIALQGSAETSSGDLIAEAVVTRQQLADPVRLTINRVIP